MYPILKALLK